MIGNRLARLLTLMLFVFAAPVEAAQPLVTDDAAVVASKTCQLEAWTRSAHDGRAYGAQPACNFTGNLELTVGGARAKPDDGESLLISRRPPGGTGICFRRRRSRRAPCNRDSAGSADISQRRSLTWCRHRRQGAFTTLQ